MTRPTLALTVSGRRPGYLREVLDSWARVRGLDAWAVGFLVEPGPELHACRAVIDAFAAARGAGADTTTVVNPRPLGVLANPHRALRWAFEERAAPFAVLGEEDIVVDGRFSPWVWGTWADRWHELLAGRWFSAAAGPSPDVEEGYDFGIERLLAAEGRRVVIPRASRSDNIGEHGGVHALPEDFAQSRAATFAAHREPVIWEPVIWEPGPTTAAAAGRRYAGAPSSPAPAGASACGPP